MFSMPRDPAKWPNFLTDQEREELALAERVKTAAADQVRALKSRLKHRAIKRMQRAKEPRK